LSCGVGGAVDEHDARIRAAGFGVVVGFPQRPD
jgi:hypothetical protein